LRVEKSFGEKLEKIAIDAGASGAAVVSSEKVSFRREFRADCERNSCGRYGKSWTCPPDVGDIDEMISKAKKYKHMLIFQSIAQLQDSYDIKGMKAAAIAHSVLTHKVAEKLKDLISQPLALGAGACLICPSCTKEENVPCRHPDKALVSLEAYGIDVSKLAAASGLAYINGKNTVTFFGGVMF